jgi:hypothetical protein
VDPLIKSQEVHIFSRLGTIAVAQRLRDREERESDWNER